MTCYDLRFPELARALVDAGAEVLVVPAAWVAGPRKVDHWRTLVRARAIENTVYVVAAGQPGPRYSGHSLVVDPLGDVLAEAEDGPATAPRHADPGRAWSEPGRPTRPWPTDACTSAHRPPTNVRRRVSSRPPPPRHPRRPGRHGRAGRRSPPSSRTSSRSRREPRSRTRSPTSSPSSSPSSSPRRPRTPTRTSRSARRSSPVPTDGEIRVTRHRGPRDAPGLVDPVDLGAGRGGRAGLPGRGDWSRSAPTGSTASAPSPSSRRTPGPWRPAPVAGRSIFGALALALGAAVLALDESYLRTGAAVMTCVVSASSR